MMTMKDRWIRYAKTIECDCCNDRIHVREDDSGRIDDDEAIIAVESSWYDFGFMEDNAPEPSRPYLPTTCEACRHFLAGD